MSKAFPKTNTELRKDVEEELIWDPAIPMAGIGVSVTEHAVTLTGTVDSLASRLAAVRATKRVKGVHTIADDIVVHVAGDHSDPDIAAHVEAALTWSFETPSSVHATIRNGAVTLDGVVDWDFQRRAAERVVQDVAGVRTVTNDIALRHTESAHDVHARISSALHRSATIDAGNITVTSTGGEVSLTGTVSSWAERDTASQAAWAAKGVTKVIDHLTIR
jgi:osmotically-inducible protein OsmY